MGPATEERRQHKRYKLENSVSISSEGIFQVVDISRGGFCFTCPPHTTIKDFWVTDIISSVASLEDFPTKRVWVSIAENSGHEYLPTVVGVKFGTLTQNQETILLQLLVTLDQSSSTLH
jgi:hypothetical protein